MRRTSRRTLLAALPVVVSLVLAGCADGGAAAPDPSPAGAGGAPAASVVVTTSILGDIATNVLEGSGAEVQVLLPAGADPHGYAPSAADGVTLREADLVVAVGLGLEEQLEDTLEAAEADGVEVLRVGEQVDPIEYGAAHADPDEHADEAEDEHAEQVGDEHGHEGELDPHVWLDPTRAADIGQQVATAYADLVPEAGEAVTAAADEYEDELLTLDEELQELVATLPEGRRQLVTNHDAVGYLADRYDLEVVATVLPGTSADVDVTASSFTRLVELLRGTGIPAVFAETTSTDRLAQALAEEVEGVQVVELYTDSLGEPGSDGDSLVDMLRTDIERIVAALG